MNGTAGEVLSDLLLQYGSHLPADPAEDQWGGGGLPALLQHLTKGEVRVDERTAR